MDDELDDLLPRRIDPRLAGGPASELADALDAAGVGYVLVPIGRDVAVSLVGVTNDGIVPQIVARLYELDEYARSSGESWHSAVISLDQAENLASGIRYRLDRQEGRG